MGEKSSAPELGSNLRMGPSIGSVIRTTITTKGWSSPRLNQESTARPTIAMERTNVSVDTKLTKNSKVIRSCPARFERGRDDS